MRRTFLNLALLSLLLQLVLQACGQSLQDGSHATGTDNDANTLHVYVDLMQIPVMVLDRFLNPVLGVPGSQFRVKLQDLPEFVPSHVRVQSDDPLSLAILIDNSSSAENLWQQLPASAGALAASLHPWDTVALFVMDSCKLQVIGGAGTNSEEELYHRLKAAMSFAPYRGAVSGDCSAPVSLWSSMLYIAEQQRIAQGRRVMFALSNGRRSAEDWLMEQLHHNLTSNSISVFNLWHGTGESGSYLPNSTMEGSLAATVRFSEARCVRGKQLRTGTNTAWALRPS